MTDTALSALIDRVQRLEDRWELVQLIAGYGPAVDRGDGDAAAGTFTHDGVFDQHDAECFTGYPAIRGLYDRPATAALVDRGMAHVAGLPVVELNGDAARVLSYTRVYVPDGDGFRASRVAVNRFECVRTGEGWRVRHRTSRPIDGSDTMKQLLR